MPHILTDGFSCSEREADIFQASVDLVIEFLTKLFHEGLSYETLNSARRTLSNICNIQDGYHVGSRPLTIRCMSGVFNLCPTKARYSGT